MPITDANQKKDVAKVSDKPLEQGQDVADKARHALSLEATAKPGEKTVLKAEAGSSHAYSDFINASFDKASTTIKQTMAMLPSLAIDSDTGKKINQKNSTDISLDFDSILKKNCVEPTEKECKPATGSAFDGFNFVASKKVEEEADAKGIQTKAEFHLNKTDWDKAMAAFEKVGKPNSAQATADVSVHRDQNGKVDVIRQGNQTLAQTAEGGQLVMNEAGDVLQKDANGEVQFHMQDGKFMGKLASGRNIVVEEDEQGNKRAYILDAQGNPTSEVYEGESGSYKVIGKFENGRIVTSNSTVEQAGGINKLAEDMEAEAIRTKTNQFQQLRDGIMTVTPDGSVIAAKKDGTALISISEGRYLVRNADKSWTIHEKNKAAVHLSQGEVQEILKDKAPERRGMVQAIKALISFGKDQTLTNADGSSTITMSGDRMQGRVNETKAETDASGQTVVTGLVNGESQTIDTQAKTLEVKHADGKVDRIATGPKGFKFTGKGYNYDSGKVTTTSGDVITSNGIQMANGTQIHRDGSIDFADGTRIKSDGTIVESATYSKKESERTMAQAADSKAASVAGYAMGKAGEIRSRAASGHATASDIASLEAAFAGLCEAVTALSGNCDPSTQFKLYTAKSSVSESISVGKAHLNTGNKPVGVAA